MATALSPLQQQSLMQKQKPVTPLTTMLEQLRNDTPADQPVSEKSPQLAKWISSPFDQNPVEKQTLTKDRLKNQLTSIRDLGNPANEATSDALAYRQQMQVLKSAAQNQALSERQSELLNRIGQGFDFGGGSMFGDVGKGSKRSKVIQAAENLLGTPYLWGGGHGDKPGPNYGSAHGFTGRGIDCSGLVRYAFAAAGVNRWAGSAVAATQMGYGKRTAIKNLLPGDLVARANGNHIAIYLGHGKIIEAPHTGARVRIRSIRPGEFVGIRLGY